MTKVATLTAIAGVLVVSALVFTGRTDEVEGTCKMPGLCTSDHVNRDAPMTSHDHVLQTERKFTAPIDNPDRDRILEVLDVLVTPHLRDVAAIKDDAYRKTSHLTTMTWWEFMGCDGVTTKEMRDLISRCADARAEQLAQRRRSTLHVAMERAYTDGMYTDYTERKGEACYINLAASILKICSRTWNDNGMNMVNAIYEPADGFHRIADECPAHALVTMPQALFDLQKAAGKTTYCLPDAKIAQLGLWPLRAP